MSYSGSTKNLCGYIAKSDLDTTSTLNSAFTINSIKVHANGSHVFGNGSTLPSFNKEVRVVGASVKGPTSASHLENKGLYCSNTLGNSRVCSQLNGNNASTSSANLKATPNHHHNVLIGLPSTITGKVSPSSSYGILQTRSFFSFNFVLKD
jgi:hypothetical protein